MESNTLMSRAQRAECLDSRIEENKAAQQLDLIEWIFSRLEIEETFKIFEICAGTGNQTAQFVKVVKGKGHVIALDASSKALRTFSDKLDAGESASVTTIESDIDKFPSALYEHGVSYKFDLIFCAYGLYYSKNTAGLLSELKQWLALDGKIVVVGPFGPNNSQLFELLEDNEVTISEYVTYSSRNFFFKEVLPWASDNFKVTTFHTVENPVRWKSVDSVLNYWKNTTFYDEGKFDRVKQSLERHFEKHGEFVNNKWIMMAEMSDARI